MQTTVHNGITSSRLAGLPVVLRTHTHAQIPYTSFSLGPYRIFRLDPDTVDQREKLYAENCPLFRVRLQ